MLHAMAMVAAASIASAVAHGQTSEREPNNTFPEATAISSGAAVTGQLSSSTDVDVYAITVDGKGALDLSLTKSSGTVFYVLTVYSGSGTPLATYSAGTGGTFTQTTAATAPGVYYIEIKKGAAWSGDQYSLLATFHSLVPALSVQPVDASVAIGSATFFMATATGEPPLTHQWYKNGSAYSTPVVSATSTLNFPNVSLSDDGLYKVVVTNSLGSITSREVRLTVIAPAAQSLPRLVNLSVLISVPSDGVVAGFVLRGDGNRKVVARAVGPSLSAFGVPATLPDPQLTLYSRDTVIKSNNDWAESDAATMIAVGAFPLPPSSRDAVVTATLAPGDYTVRVNDTAGRTGTVLVEVYEAP